MTRTGRNRALAAFRTLALRWVALITLSTWFGGFTFYSAVVIPVLDDVMGRVETGSLVTREVTATLNLIGVATLAAWWVLLASERNLGGPWARRGRVGLVLVDTAVMVLLFLMHAELDRRLDAGLMTGFYPLHELYLIASTVQWAANIGLVAVSLWIWRAPPAWQES